MIPPVSSCRRTRRHGGLVGLYLCLALLVGVLGCRIATAAEDSTRTLTDAVFVLAGETPPGPEAAWSPLSLPDRWRDSRPGVGGHGWYRLMLPGGLPQVPLAVFIEDACLNIEVWLNGSLVGSGGNMAEPITRNCYQPQFFALPGALLRTTGNELLIHLVAHPHTHAVAVQRTGTLSEVELGPLRALQERYTEEMFLRVGLNQSMVLLEAAMGLAMLVLWGMRRRDTVYLYFGLLMLSWSAVTARLLVREWLGYQQFEWITVSLTAWVGTLALIFLMRYAERRMPRVEAALWAIPLLVALVFALIPTPWYFRASSVWYLWLRFETFVGMALFLGWAWRRRHPDFWVMVVAMAAVAAALSLETLGRHGLVPITTRHYVNLALPLFFLVIGWRLVRLFATALQRAEDSVADLEQRVAQRTQEIASAYEELGRVRQEQAASVERERIAADLHDDLGARLLMITHRAAGGPLAELARTAMQDLRTLIYGLSGGTVPLVDAIADWRAEARARTESAGFDLAWDADGVPANALLTPQARSATERVLREGLTNALRHSGGDRITVRIALDGGVLAVDVRDNGATSAAPTQWRPGYGTRSLAGRAARLGAQIQWHAAPGGGTELSYRMPLETAATAEAVTPAGATPAPDCVPPGPPPPANTR